MRDWGGYRGLMEQAREDAKPKPITACPIDGEPLVFNERLQMWGCPMGNYRIAGTRSGA